MKARRLSSRSLVTIGAALLTVSFFQQPCEGYRVAPAARLKAQANQTADWTKERGVRRGAKVNKTAGWEHERGAPRGAEVANAAGESFMSLTPIPEDPEIMLLLPWEQEDWTKFPRGWEVYSYTMPLLSVLLWSALAMRNLDVGKMQVKCWKSKKKAPPSEMHAKPTIESVANVQDLSAFEESDSASYFLCKLRSENTLEPFANTVWTIVGIMWPNAFGHFLCLMTEIVNVVTIGHTNQPVHLAGFGLGNAMVNIVATTVCSGLCGALDPLVSRAFHLNMHQQSVYWLQRCRVIVMAQLIWILPLLWNIRRILVALGQDPAVSAHAQAYCRACCFGIPALFQFAAINGFLRNRGKVLVPVMVSGVTGLLHTFWCNYFVNSKGFMTAGVGYANAASWWVGFLLLTLYVALSRDCGLSVKSLLWVEGPGLKEFQTFISHSTSSVFQCCCEGSLWEFLTFLAGFCGPVGLAAHVAMGNCVAIAFLPVVGLSVAATEVVEEFIEARMPKHARRAAIVCLGLNLVVWFMLTFAGSMFSSAIASFYTNSKDVLRTMQRLLRIFLVAGFCDSAQSIMRGLSRGLSLTQQSAFVFILTYYGLVLPAAVTFVFSVGLGVEGIWYASVIGTAFGAATFTVMLFKVNFESLAAELSASLSSDRTSFESLVDTASERGG